jgi:hypothetical protein
VLGRRLAELPEHLDGDGEHHHPVVVAAVLRAR